MWHSLGFDEQQCQVESYLQHLYTTKNNSIAKKFEQSDEVKDAVFELLWVRSLIL